jgi:antitoxin (DNA-binding transcriptional repressor) of toxin-antitoxin stability system
MSSSEARAALPDVLDRVARGEEVTITRHGVAVAVVVRPDALRSRRADEVLAGAAKVQDLLAAARAGALPRGGLSAERADELVAEVRSGRDGR